MWKYFCATQNNGTAKKTDKSRDTEGIEYYRGKCRRGIRFVGLGETWEKWQMLERRKVQEKKIEFSCVWCAGCFKVYDWKH